MKQVNIGMAGTGFAADFHAEAARHVTGISAVIVAVTSGHFDNAVRFAQQHNVGKKYQTYDEMLGDADIDVVDLCVPTHLHLPMALQAAAAGKHVIV